MENITHTVERKKLNLTHTVESKELKPGDHIYTWRKLKSYAHHGIYKGNDIVIHFRGKQGQQESPPMFSALITPPPPDCKECYDYRKREMGDPEKAVEEVSISCLRCFLAGGKLKRALYSVSEFEVTFKRPMTCFTATADPPEKVLERATILLKNGFGSYKLLLNNCEDFAFYCTTGKDCPHERQKKISVAIETGAKVVSGAGKAVTKACKNLRTNYRGEGPM